MAQQFGPDWDAVLALPWTEIVARYAVAVRLWDEDWGFLARMRGTLR